MTQVEPMASDVPHVFDCENTELPLSEIAAMLRGPLPEFVSVTGTFCVVPETTEPKLTADVLSAATGLPLTPVPARLITCDPVPSVTDSADGNTPAPNGVNSTEITQLASGARDVPQLLVVVK
jgi:hypothetical protein